MSHRSSRAEPRLHRVVAIVDENSNPFEMSCTVEIFGIDRPELGRRLYDFALCAPGGRTRMRDGVFTVTGVADLALADTADTLIVPNRPDVRTPRRPGVLAAIARAHDRGARLIGLCSGAFTLAEAGVLDGRRATAHWQWADEFRARFPAVTLCEDVLFVDDGDVLTAAGSAAALDLGLHVVRRDHGAEIANSVSRRLVFGHREGGQRQFIDRPLPATTDQSLAPLLDWAGERLEQPLGVAELAARAAVSPATLYRRFADQLGTTPLAWITGQRVLLARRLLETGETPLETVARHSGLGSATNLRAVLRRATGLTPSDYRRRFGASPGSPAESAAW